MYSLWHNHTLPTRNQLETALKALPSKEDFNFDLSVNGDILPIEASIKRIESVTDASGATDLSKFNIILNDGYAIGSDQDLIISYTEPLAKKLVSELINCVTMATILSRFFLKNI